MFIPFRFKVLGAFLALLSAVLVSSLIVVSRVETSQAEARVREQLGVTRDVFQSVLLRRERQLATALSLLAGDFAFKKAVSTRDPATIESAGLNFQRRIGSDALWVTDENGELFADTSRELQPGRPMDAIGPVSHALEGEPSADILLMNGVPYQVAAVPLNAPDLIGVLAAGFRISDETAAEIKRMTLTEVSFATSDRIVASTLPPEDRRALETARTGLQPGQTALVGAEGSRYLVLPMKPAPEVAVFLQNSWDGALEPLRRLRQLLVLVGLAGIALTLVLGLFLAGGVTAPVAKLASATRRLAQGDHDVHVDLRQRDEIGQLGDAFNQMVQGLREREKIRSVLRKAVSKEIADELLKRGQIDLGGEERTITVLFSDIRGFTSISEKLSPRELVSQLNAYFSRMTRAVEKHGGVVDKFIGDAVMALFGAPVASPDDAANAHRAALAMIAALNELNSERISQGLPPWENGIGLNTGTAVAGTLGAEERWSYTAIGDAVNLASRLEGLTKHYGARLLVSRAAANAAKGVFIYRTADLVRVKGKEEPVDVLEVLGEGDSAPDWLGPYEDGVSAYRTRRFAEAQSLFERTLALRPDDAPSRMYLARLQPLLKAAPADWDPAHTMYEK